MSLGSRCGRASVGVLAAAFAPNASAGYIGHVEGAGGESAANVLAGETFGVRIMLDPIGTPAGFDAAVFRLLVDRSGLAVGPAWYDWAGPFVTAGIDDATVPANDTSGLIDGASYTDPFDADAVDLYFENLTAAPGDRFAGGVLVTLEFLVPSDTPIGTQFAFSFEADTFSDGASLIDVQAGSGFVATVVVPAPATLAVLATVLGAGRRRAC